MSTTIRPEISTKNKYWIDKHRHYELKHLCLQYPLWKRKYATYDSVLKSSCRERIGESNDIYDPTATFVEKKMHYSDKMYMIEKAAKETDIELYEYILKAVTEGLSYTYLKSVLEIPCSKDTYYDRYRKFFWILNELRG